MKFPDLPRDGVPVIKTVTEIINYMRAARVTSVIGGKLKTTTGGTTIEIPSVTSSRSGGASSHPFKLYGKTSGGACLLHTWEGACTTNGWIWSSTSVYGATRELVPTIGAGVLIGPEMPIGNAGAGYLTLTASTTYGIWLKVGAQDNFPVASIYNPIAGLFPNSANVHFQTFNFTGAAIEADSTNTDPTDATTAGGAEFLAIYLGKVAVDADGVGTITQYRKSDVTLCEPLMTSPIVVSDTTNDITVGTDGGAVYVAP